MISERKIAANRRNSQRSTGPRTAAGKARVRRNALRHGLAAVAVRDPRIVAQAHQLALAICGEDGEATHREQALMIAESELTVTQVRDARANVIEQMFANGAAQEGDESHRLTAQEENPYQSHLEQLLRLDRYERGAISRRARALRALFARCPEQGGNA